MVKRAEMLWRTMQIVTACFLAFPRTVSAQPAAAPTEQVTVTGQKVPPDAVVNQFVQTFKSGRWETAICPLTAGLSSKFIDFVTQRVRTVATQVGAPVNKNASCRPNIEIVFTITPQEFLDGVRRNHTAYLGYYENSRQADDLAKVTHTIQAWYTTETKDMNGSMSVDSGKRPLTTIRVPSPDPPGFVELTISANVKRVLGSRVKTGLHTAFFNVLVVADPTKLKDYEIGALADYVAVISLARLNMPDTCLSLPSIIDLLQPDCERPNQITESDLGFLGGLYTGSADGMKQDEIVYQLKHSLGAEK